MLKAEFTGTQARLYSRWPTSSTAPYSAEMQFVRGRIRTTGPSCHVIWSCFTDAGECVRPRSTKNRSTSEDIP
jgi:hypothetical protein